MNSELKRPARGSKVVADERVRFAPVVIDGLPPFRGEFLVDFALLNELIVLVGIALEDVPAKDMTRDTILTKYVCTHTFTSDLSDCRNTALEFRVKAYHPSQARLYRDGEKLVLSRTHEQRSLVSVKVYAGRSNEQSQHHRGPPRNHSPLRSRAISTFACRLMRSYRWDFSRHLASAVGLLHFALPAARPVNSNHRDAGSPIWRLPS